MTKVTATGIIMPSILLTIATKATATSFCTISSQICRPSLSVSSGASSSLLKLLTFYRVSSLFWMYCNTPNNLSARVAQSVLHKQALRTRQKPVIRKNTLKNGALGEHLGDDSTLPDFGPHALKAMNELEEA